MRTERLEDLGAIARGGMATVNRVRDGELRRHLAMKLLNPELAGAREEIERFLEEAQVTAQLDHPNVPPVHELGVGTDGRHFFTMKLVEGRTLEQLLGSEGFDPRNQALLFRTLQVFLKVCEAVSFAHSRGVIHCDLKPANVMVGSHGQVYVMDWGIARLPIDRGVSPERAVTVARANKRIEPKGRVLGTLGYMAPEQARARHDDIDERTDVFALGAILYRILVGQAIYPTANVDEALARAMYAEVTPPARAAEGRNLPPRLCAIALKALACEREDRFQTVEALHGAVEAYLRGDGRHPVKTFREGELIVREGDPATCAFILTEGRCLVWKLVDGRRQNLRELGPGDIFGETAIFASTRRTATVEATDDCTVVEVSAQSLDEELGRTYVMPDVVRAMALRFQDRDARASRLRSAAEDGMLERLILRHFALHGADAAGGERVAPWAPLRQELVQSGVSQEAAAALASTYAGVRVEEAAGQVFFAEVLLDEVLEVPPPPPRE